MDDRLAVVEQLEARFASVLESSLSLGWKREGGRVEQRIHFHLVGVNNQRPVC